MLFRQLFDKDSSTYTYLIGDRVTKQVILVDPVLEQVERDWKLLQELNLTLCYCLETHIHADHITGSGSLRRKTGCLVIVPENANVTCADRYIKDREVLQLGMITIQAISTPGHTDSHIAYLINNSHLLTGDALLIRGCGRTDLQGGNAGKLYDSVTQKLFILSDSTLIYPGHDYQGRSVSTIGEEKILNPRFFVLEKGYRSKDSFIHLMNNLNLPYPQKMTKAIPANQYCGDEPSKKLAILQSS